MDDMDTTMPQDVVKTENSPEPINQYFSIKEDDHMNFYRLLQLFPYFPPVYLQRIYAECNSNFTRTIDNILYVKRYCSYLHKKKINPVDDGSTIHEPNNMLEEVDEFDFRGF